MEATSLRKAPDPYYTNDGLIKVQPREWANGYAAILTAPWSRENRTLVTVLGELLLSETSVTRLQVAESLAQTEGVSEIDRRLLVRVEGTRKRLEQIIPGLVVHNGVGKFAQMTLDPTCLKKIKLDEDDEKSARATARNLARERVNAEFSAKIYNRCGVWKRQFHLSDGETSELQLILRYGRKGYKPYCIRGVDSIFMVSIRGLLAKLPPGTIHEEGGSYFVRGEILDELGENISSYEQWQARVENPDGSYPLPILPSMPTMQVEPEIIPVKKQPVKPKSRPIKEPASPYTAVPPVIPRKLDYGYRRAYPKIGSNDVFVLSPSDPAYSAKTTALAVRRDEILVYMDTPKGRHICKVPKDALAE